MVRTPANPSLSGRIDLSADRIGRFCERWGISEFALFGSVLRPDFGPESDVDVLVSFEPGVRHGLFDLIQMEEELKGIFGRDVDVMTRRGVEVSDNASRSQEILNTAEVVYVRR